jgi:hypothetical protein
MTTFDRCSCSCLRALLIGVSVVATPGATTAAQRQSATLEGTVQDSSGAVVSSATVTVRDLETNLIRTTQTDPVGLFRLADLPIGTYEVRVEGRGCVGGRRHAGRRLNIAGIASFAASPCDP